MAIGDDFGIDYTNKRIYHKANTNTYTVNELYTWIMETFDELVQMDNEVPMDAQTPNAYRMINRWFLDIGEGSFAHRYLKEGAITTYGYDCGTWFDGIRAIAYNATTAFSSSDIGETITGTTTTDTGTIVGYDERYTAGDAGIVWIRPDAADDAFDNGSESYTVSNSSAAGAFTAVSNTGEELFANVYTLGTIASTPNAQIYIFQNGSAVTEWSNLDNWDRGHIDIVLQVKEWGTEIDGAEIDVFARQQGDLFSHFEIDLTDGGRNAVPLSTSADLNNTTPDYYIMFDTLSGGTFSAGDVIQHPTSGTVEWSAEIVSSPVQYAATGTYLCPIRGYKDDGTNSITDNDAFEETTGTVTAAVYGSATGCLGTGYIDYASQTGNYTTGDVLTGGTSGAKRRILADIDNGTDGQLLYDTNTGITGTSREAYYTDYDFSPSTETITDDTTGSATTDSANVDAVSGFDDITIAFVNGTVDVDAISGSLTPGERITWTDGGSQEGIFLYQDAASGAGNITVGNCTDDTFTNDVVITGDLSGQTVTVDTGGFTSAHTMNKNFEQQSANPYDVIVECGSIYEAGRPLADVYEYFKFVTEEDSTFTMYTVVGSTITELDGEEYIKAYTGYAEKPESPLGSFAGGVLFGAQGVWVEGMDTDDNENFSLIDSNGTVQNPNQQATVRIIELVSGDRVSVFFTSGGNIDKAMYNSHDTNNVADDTDFVIEEAIDTDIPASGVIRVVDDDGTTTMKEQRYRYSSWDTSTFTLVTGATGSCTTGGSSYTTTLIDSAADFGGTDDIEPGDMIVNTTDNSSGVVISIDSPTQITHTPLEGGTNNYWTQTTDNYTSNILDRTYDDGDTVYVPLIDREADATTEEQAVIYDTARTFLVRVRKKGIVPFETTGTLAAGIQQIAAIRTTDGIVS